MGQLISKVIGTFQGIRHLMWHKYKNLSKMQFSFKNDFACICATLYSYTRQHAYNCPTNLYFELHVI